MILGKRGAEWVRGIRIIWKVAGGVLAIFALLFSLANFLDERVVDERVTYAFKEWWHDLGRDKIVKMDSDIEKPRYIFSLDRLHDDRLDIRDEVVESIYDLKILNFWDSSDKNLKYDWKEVFTLAKGICRTRLCRSSKYAGRSLLEWLGSQKR